MFLLTCIIWKLYEKPQFESISHFHLLSFSIWKDSLLCRVERKVQAIMSTIQVVNHIQLWTSLGEDFISVQKSTFQSLKLLLNFSTNFEHLIFCPSGNWWNFLDLQILSKLDCVSGNSDYFKLLQWSQT